MAHEWLVFWDRVAKKIAPGPMQAILDAVAASDIVAPQGRGIAGISDPDSEGQSTVSYTDGTTSSLHLPPGPMGAPNALTIGTVAGGATAGATLTGTPPEQILNLTLPKGDAGPKGDTGAKGDPGTGVPTGTIVMWGTGTAPSGWLLLQGQTVSRTTYSALYAVLGTLYGAGDGSTTFRLPNLKGSVPVGLDAAQTEFATLGQSGGEKAHALTAAENGPHTHGPLTAGYRYMYNGGTGSQGLRETPNVPVSNSDTTASSGSGTPHNNLQPYLVLNYIVKT